MGTRPKSDRTQPSHTRNAQTNDASSCSYRLLVRQKMFVISKRASWPSQRGGERLSAGKSLVNFPHLSLNKHCPHGLVCLDRKPGSLRPSPEARPFTRSVSRIQAKFTVGGNQRLLHRFFFDHKRNVALRGALRNGDQVYAVASKGAESFARNPRNAAHVFANHGDNRDMRIHGDVFDVVVREVMSELLAQRLHRALRVSLRNDYSEFVLRSRLRHQQSC